MHDLAAFENRLRKLAKARKAWALKEETDAYRLYDQDIPELKYIVDAYGDHLVVYDLMGPRPAGPAHGEAPLDSERESPLRESIALATGVPLERIHLKERKRISARDAQYERLGATGVKIVVREESSRYQVNLSDYLDTGLFLDHRPLRKRFRKLTPGTSLLNLFCYTGSVSVAAAAAGVRTVNVDLSATYLDWARDNFRLSGLHADNHLFVRTDARSFLRAGPSGELNAQGQLYDLVFLDPPSFSNSKRMVGTLDIQRDHRALIVDGMAFVAPGGTLYFSTNLSKFRLDPKLADLFHVKDVTKETIPSDFRNPLVHRCFALTTR